MLKDTPATCAACGDGVPVGVIPAGALKDRPGCDACLRACAEVVPRRVLDVEPRPLRARRLCSDDDTGLAEESYYALVAARGWR